MTEQGSGATGEAMDLARVLHELVYLLDRRANAVLRPFGLVVRQHIALTVIGQYPGLTGKDLSHAIQVTPAAVTGLVRSLVAAGLVVDEARPGGGHRQALRLTPEGTAVLGRTTGALGATVDDQARSAGLDPVELTGALGTLLAHLNASEGD